MSAGECHAPPATRLVVMVAGSRAQAEAAREDVEAVLQPVGLRLAPAKNRTCHIDEGFSFLGFRIRRMRKRGSAKRGDVRVCLTPHPDPGFGLTEQVPSKKIAISPHSSRVLPTGPRSDIVPLAGRLTHV